MMFTSLRFTEGFPTKLKGVEDRKFEFTPGLNLIYGQNGCGKTTILKTLAAYTGINMSRRGGGGGWSGPPRDTVFRGTYPEGFSELTPDKCKAVVEWDGVPAFFNSASLSEQGPTMGYFVDSEESSPDGMMDMGEQVQLMFSNYSEGQLREYNLGKVMKRMDNPPQPYLTPPSIPRPRQWEIDYAAYVSSLTRLGPHTLLWDEPDRSLSFEKQYIMWTRLLPDIAKKYQVIVASHSCMPLLMELPLTFNLIDVDEGYFFLSQIYLKTLVTPKKAAESEKPTTPKDPPVFDLDSLQIEGVYEVLIAGKIRAASVTSKTEGCVEVKNLTTKRSSVIVRDQVPNRFIRKIHDLPQWRLHHGE